jgi:hypothetical protein
MLIDTWSVALLGCALLSLLLLLGAVPTALAIVRNFQPGEDSIRQIALENQAWLAALLIRYGLVLQILSLVLLVLAADAFARVLPGAMCATGAFLANPYGLPALTIKLAAALVYGGWLVVHHLDLQCEDLPFTRTKFLLLLVLLPLVIGDSYLLFRYLVDLEPDILTSCCGVVLAKEAGPEQLWFATLSEENLLLAIVIFALILWLTALFLLRAAPTTAGRGAAAVLLLAGSPVFAALALLTITLVISPYVYALPSHRCPFDLFAAEYSYFGVPLYLALFAAVFSGLAAGIAGLATRRREVGAILPRFSHRSLRSFLVFLPIFFLIAAFHPLRYLLGGGQ